MTRNRRYWEALLIFNGLFIAWFWLHTTLQFVDGSIGLWLVAVGRLFGLGGAYAILLQFLLMGRMPWLERPFGFDRLSRIHHQNGKIALFLLLLHPVFLVVGYGLLSHTGFIAQFIGIVLNLKHVLWALIGMTLLCIVVGTSITIVRLRLKYETWYFVHLATYAAVFLSFWHQLDNGTTLLHEKLFWWYWIALYSTVFGSHLIFRILRPFALLGRHRFRVTQIVRETPSTISVHIAGRSLDRFGIRAGQFMVLRFLTKGMWWQAHPFSLSVAPDGRHLRVTARELGDFTRQIYSIPQGTRVLIEGPYGIFTDSPDVLPKILFIAGGIGITPIRALIETMAPRGKDIVLLYGNTTATDVPFKSELEDITRRFPNVRMTYVMSNDPSWNGEHGHIDTARIQRLVPDVVTREVFLCGPPIMMKLLDPELIRIGVPRERIHWERFALA